MSVLYWKNLAQAIDSNAQVSLSNGVYVGRIGSGGNELSRNQLETNAWAGLYNYLRSSNGNTVEPITGAPQITFDRQYEIIPLRSSGGDIIAWELDNDAWVSFINTDAGSYKIVPGVGSMATDSDNAIKAEAGAVATLFYHAFVNEWWLVGNTESI